MHRSPLDDAARLLQDAAYVTVGLGVLAYQRLQVRRRELGKSLGDRSTASAAPTITR